METINTKPTLFIGGHPDDVFISSGISIHRNPGNSYVLTLTDGAPKSPAYYPYAGGDWKVYYGPKAYSEVRIEEDRTALRWMRLPEDNYFNGMFGDQELHKDVPGLVDLIERTIQKTGVKRVVTHTYPQSHPDHEVACIASHMAAQMSGVEVWEYPMYIIGSNGRRQFGIVDDKLGKDITIVEFKHEEFDIKDLAIQAYQSQPGIKQLYTTTREIFIRSQRNLESIDDFVPYIPELASIRPVDVREALRSTISQ